MSKILKIEISGWGGEQTIGKITKAQASYWLEKNEDEFIEHIQGFDDVEHDEPINEWYENNNVDHTYGCNLDPTIYVTFGDENEIKYKDIKKFSKDNLKTVTMETLEKDEPYLICFSEDKGNFFEGEIEIPDDVKYNPSDIVIQTKNILGDEFIVGVLYKHEEIDNLGPDSVGKGFNARIVYPADELDD